MLYDILDKTINQMKRLDTFENAAINAELKAKNESDYKNLINDFYNTIKKIELAFLSLGYTVSVDTINNIEESLEIICKIESDGIIDIEPLSNAKQSINRKINPSLCKEWSLFYQNKTSGCISKLNTLGHLLPDNESTSTIKTNIVNGSEWNDLTICGSSNSSRLTLLKDALESINELEEKLNLSDDVKDFVAKVTSKKAKISDINDTIMEWISKEHLDDRFIISFKN